MGWGPVAWVGRVLPEAKFEKMHLVFYFFYLSNRYRDICKIRSDDRQTNGQTDFPLIDSTPERGRVKNSMQIDDEIYTDHQLPGQHLWTCLALPLSFVLRLLGKQWKT